MLKAGTAARRRTLSWDTPVDATDIRQGVEHFLGRLDGRLQTHEPAWVGHCKLLITSDQATAYASITASDDQPRWAGEPGSGSHVEATIYVALYGWSDAEVAAALDDTLAREPIIAAAPDAQVTVVDA